MTIYATNKLTITQYTNHLARLPAMAGGPGGRTVIARIGPRAIFSMNARFFMSAPLLARGTK